MPSIWDELLDDAGAPRGRKRDRPATEPSRPYRCRRHGAGLPYYASGRSRSCKLCVRERYDSPPDNGAEKPSRVPFEATTTTCRTHGAGVPAYIITRTNGTTHVRCKSCHCAGRGSSTLSLKARRARAHLTGRVSLQQASEILGVTVQRITKCADYRTALDPQYDRATRQTWVLRSAIRKPRASGPRRYSDTRLAASTSSRHEAARDRIAFVIEAMSRSATLSDQQLAWLDRMEKLDVPWQRLSDKFLYEGGRVFKWRENYAASLKCDP